MAYRNGDKVHVGDLVIRLRDRKDTVGGANKHDKHDVFDGPWLIAKVPGAPSTPEGQVPNARQGHDPRGSNDDGKAATSRESITLAASTQLGPSLATASPQTHVSPMANEERDRLTKNSLVKLRMPHGTKANPWTALHRLIPLRVPEYDEEQHSRLRDIADLALRQTGEPTSLQEEAASLSRTPSDVEPEDHGGSGLVRLPDGFEMRVHHIAAQGLAATNTYEVGKLRGKKVRRFKKGQAKGRRTDDEDPWIVRYRSNGGQVKRGRMLAVDYLVHWAGWPSEDDTWEPGEGLPQACIDDYHASADPWREDDTSEDGEGGDAAGDVAVVADAAD
ncbi:MAG: hypothetical protein M1833_003439 [Piccolia ochrophora]|nr:MAG: hypothetical protein M1833_003439 [Piccolia ochrophora]